MKDEGRAKAAQSQVQARCRPPASQELGSCSLVLLLCSSCVALVSLLFSGGALRRTTAAPSRPKLVLTVLVGWLFTCNRIFRQIPCGLPFSVQAAPKPHSGEGRRMNEECRRAGQSRGAVEEVPQRWRHRALPQMLV